MSSKQDSCHCGRICAAIIGWIQTLFSAILLIGATVVFVFTLIAHYDAESDRSIGRDDPDHSKKNIVLVLLQLVIILLFLIGFLSGILLVSSVNQKNSGKLKIWIIIQLIVWPVQLLIAFLTVDLTILSIDLTYGHAKFVLKRTLWGLLGICIVNTLCLWIVNAYRKDVLKARKEKEKLAMQIF